MEQSSKKLKLLGGEIEVVLYDIDSSFSGFVFNKIFKEGLRLQKVFNVFDSGSEISVLNSKRKLKASKELLEAIKLALPYCELTGGAYDITLGRQIIQRKSGKKLTPLNCSYKDITISGEVVSLSHPDVLLDLGSMAKGYIGDQLAGLTKELGVESAFIDLRGDLVMFGKHEEKILVQHPRDNEKTIYSFGLKNAAVATSGDYTQYFTSFDECHIVGKKEFISATVVSKTLAEADIVATCLMVSGNLKLFSGKSYLLVGQDLNIIKSKEFENEVN